MGRSEAIAVDQVLRLNFLKLVHVDSAGRDQEQDWESDENRPILFECQPISQQNT
jgi:hypothetical protein